MSLFAIADLHLSLNSNKSMEVFEGWKDYVRRIETNWNHLVGENDTVVIAGDLSWAMTMEEGLADFQFVHTLPGKKIIIKGNHDYWWGTKKKMDAFLARHGLTSITILHNDAYEMDSLCVCGSRGWFFEEGEEDDKKVLLREAQRLRVSLEAASKTGKEPVAFLHYPPLTQDARCQEILSVLKEFPVRRCYYGHIHGEHGRYAFKGEWQGIAFRLISCDYTGFTPVLVS